MAIQNQGFGGTVQEVASVDRAAYVTQRPFQPGALGAYAIAIDNGGTVMAAGLAAAAPIYAFRWTDATRLCVLRSIKFSMGSVVAFVAGRMLFEVVIARSWSVADTGGTTATITTNNGKKRTSFGTTLLQEIRYSQTATLSAGTRTLDAQALGNLAVTAPTTVGPILTNQYLWQRDTADEYPLVLAQNEGVIIRATVPGTGTWSYGVQTEWAEVTAI